MMWVMCGNKKKTLRMPNHDCTPDDPSIRCFECLKTRIVVHMIRLCRLVFLNSRNTSGCIQQFLLDFYSPWNTHIVKFCLVSSSYVKLKGRYCIFSIFLCPNQHERLSNCALSNANKTSCRPFIQYLMYATGTNVQGWLYLTVCHVTILLYQFTPSIDVFFWNGYRVFEWLSRYSS